MGKRPPCPLCQGGSESFPWVRGAAASRGEGLRRLLTPSSVSRCRWPCPARCWGDGARGGSTAPACARGALSTPQGTELGSRSSPAQRPKSLPVCLLAVFLREAATSQARLCLALLHTSRLYLRLSDCVRNSRGKIMILSLVSLVGEALIAHGVSPSLRLCGPAE